jgi:DNA (cytosine-5-)-methyltransferase
MTIFRLGELFCGPGGIGLAATTTSTQLSSIKHAWATDYDPDTCATYATNICPSHSAESVICADIRELDLSILPPVDALAFGFPCNDFSTIGKQQGIDGKYGPLYTYCTEALKYFQPQWFLAENVSGLGNANEGKAFDMILNSFRDAGYKLVTHLYKFEEYGVPQARHRIIIVGIREDQNVEFKVPLPEHLRLKTKTTISQLYKRLHPDKPAYTVIGSGGGGMRMYHYSENRALTNRERARLQTFPDDYIFCGGSESVRKQIGMAVPPAGVAPIFEAILNSFDGVRYQSVDASYCDDNVCNE